MSNIKVSIIVPVYNAERFLEECLDSLINQTLQDIEILCIDDCSTDSSLNILMEYSRKDSRIKVIINSYNMGESLSRNRGIVEAKGKYIQFVDADDFIESDASRGLFEYAEKRQSDMCFMGMQTHFEGELDVKAVPCGICGQYPDIYEGKELLMILTKHNEFFYYPWSVFYKRVFIQENGFLYKKLICGAGGNFISRCMCVAKRVIVSEQKYYHYRVHNASITHIKAVEKELLIGKILRYVDVLQYFSKDEDSMELQIFLNETYKKMLGGIQSLTYNEKKEIENRLPTNFAKHIFIILCKEGQTYNIDLSEDIISVIKKKEHVIIYGAGYASKDIIELMQQNEVEILGFAVTKRKNGKTCIFGHHIYEIQELEKYKDIAIVLVAANKKYNQEIKEILEGRGFKDYIFLNVVI